MADPSKTKVEVQEDKILRIIGHQPDFTDLGRIARDYKSAYAYNAGFPRQLLPTFATKHTTDAPITGLGILEAWPTEVLLSIIAAMDIQTALRFRRANRRAHDLVFGQVAFRAVAFYAHPTLMTVLDKGLAKTLTFDQIFRALIRPRCEVCGTLACFLYLLTATKACENCIATHGHFYTATLNSYARAAECTPDTIRRRVSVMKIVVDGPEFPMTGLYRTTVEVVNVQEAFSIRPLKRNIGLGYAYFIRGFRLRHEVTVPAPTFNTATQTIYHHFTCQGCVHELGWDLNFAYDPTVWLGKEGEIKYYAAFPRCTRAYTRAELLEHYKTCKGAKDL